MNRIRRTTSENGGVEMNVRLDVVVYREDRTVIAYCPALDLCGYGQDEEEEAHKSFGICLQEYLRYALAEKTLDADLERLGWQHNKEQEAESGNLFALAVNNKELRSILDRKGFKKFNTSIPLPCC